MEVTVAACAPAAATVSASAATIFVLVKFIVNLLM
jgi:hypothetical protein